MGLGGEAVVVCYLVEFIFLSCQFIVSQRFKITFVSVLVTALKKNIPDHYVFIFFNLTSGSVFNTWPFKQ